MAIKTHRTGLPQKGGQKQQQTDDSYSSVLHVAYVNSECR